MPIVSLSSKISSLVKRFVKRYVKIPYIILKHSVVDTIRQDGVEHAGYLAFLSVLSLFPFLIFLVSIMTSIGDSEMGVKIIVLFLNSAPANISKALSPRIEEILNGPPQSLLTVAIVGIIWTASSAVEGVRTILNRAYRVSSPPPYIWRRMLSIIQFFMISVTIAASVVLLVVIPAILKKLEIMFSFNLGTDYDWLYMRQVAIFSILLFTIAALYFIIPNANQKFSFTLPGATVCVVLWVFTVNLFSFYLEKFNQFNLLYGSLGGIIGALMFFYITSLIFIIGAEFNYNFARMYHLKNGVNSKS